MQLKRFYMLGTLLLLLPSSLSFANFGSRYANWLGFDVDAPFQKGSKWHYDLMNQARLPTDPTRLEQYFVRPSVFYQFDTYWSFWLGYDFIHENPKTGSNAHEQRLWPQLEYDRALTDRVAISLRSRLEDRWLSNGVGKATRFRQRVEFTFSGWNTRNIKLDVFDEIFFGVARPTWVTHRKLDQNRVFLGLAIPVNQAISINTGYMNILRPRNPKNRYEHILVFALAIKLDGDETTVGPIRTV